MTSTFLRTFLPAKNICSISLLAVIAASLAMTPTQLLAECNRSQLAGERSKRYVIRKDEVTDLRSGLVWKLCGVGTTFWMDECTTSKGETKYLLTWDEANQAARRAGPGWRLPTKAELEDIVEKDCRNPAIDEKLFPLTAVDWYWTSSISDDGGVWQVFFGDGHSDHFERDASPSALRLVKSRK